MLKNEKQALTKIASVLGLISYFLLAADFICYIFLPEEQHKNTLVIISVILLLLGVCFILAKAILSISEKSLIFLKNHQISNLFIISILSGVIGGGLTLLGVAWTIRDQNEKLEKEEKIKICQ